MSESAKLTLFEDQIKKTRAAYSKAYEMQYAVLKAAEEVLWVEKRKELLPESEIRMAWDNLIAVWSDNAQQIMHKNVEEIATLAVVLMRIKP